MDDTDQNGVERGLPFAARWYSTSTWVALCVLLAYLFALCWYQTILWTIVAGSMDELLLRTAPIIGLSSWVLALLFRLFVRRTRRQFIWAAIRYAVIAFGSAGFLVILLGLHTPGYIRATAKFQREMQAKADVAAIRAWTLAYQPDPNAKAMSGEDAVFVPDEVWPESVKSLRPSWVVFLPRHKTLCIVFGGGFGHWGLSVGPKGQKPLGDHTVPLEDYTLPLEDGAWVWHEVQ